MERVDFREIDRFVRNQMREELVLARRGGKDHVDLALGRDRRPYRGGRFLCRGLAHFLAGLIDLYV